MSLSFGQLSAALRVEETTLRGWVAIAQNSYSLGHREGGKRVFTQSDAYVIGLFSGLYHCGVPVGPSVINDVIARVTRKGDIIAPQPGERIEIRYSDSASITLFLDKAADFVSEKIEVAA